MSLHRAVRTFLLLFTLDNDAASFLKLNKPKIEVRTIKLIYGLIPHPRE